MDVYNLKNEKVGQVEMPEKVFGVPWRPALVQQVIIAQQANARRPWAHAKDRAQVRGGGKKPWRQKGTGRARHGSIRSPIWIGGGKAHGPTNKRDFSQKINKKMRRAALLSILSRKAKDNAIKVFDTLALESTKTKNIAQSIRPILNMPKKNKRYDVLFIANLENHNLIQAARNLEKTKVVDSRSLNPVDAMNYKHVWIEQKAIPVLEKYYTNK